MSGSGSARGVSLKRVELRVDVTVEGPTITGQVAAAGFDRRFSGRLGLIAAIEEALGARDEIDTWTNDERPSP